MPELGANVGSAWVALRFSAQGAKKNIQSELDQEIGTGNNALGSEAGKKIGKNITDAVGKNTDLSGVSGKILKLSGEKATPKVEVEGLVKANVELENLGRNIDKINRKSVSARILGVVRGNGGSSSSKGGVLGSLAGSGIPGAGLLGENPAVAAGLGGLAATLVPSIAGLGIGGAAGLGGILAAQTTKQGRNLTSSLGGTIKNTLAGAVTAGGKGSFLTGLTGIFGDLSKQIKSLGPDLATMFKASLPFIKSFVGLIGPLAKTLLPSFTQVMTEFVKSGSLKTMTDGFNSLIKGMGAFLIDLGPGMRASADIFKAILVAAGGALNGFGRIFSGLAVAVTSGFHQFIDLAKLFAGVFTLNFTAAGHALQDFVKDIGAPFKAALAGVTHTAAHWFDIFRRDTASVFDTVRHNIAATWDHIFADTIGKVRTGVTNVITWFGMLASGSLSALRHLPGALYKVAATALTEFWNGAKHVAGSVLGWFGHFGSSLLDGIKHVFGIFSPSREMFQIGAHLITGLVNGLVKHAPKVHDVIGSLGGKVQAGTNVAIGKVLAARAGWTGAQWTALYQLWQRESGWDTYAKNVSSGAYGIPQSLPASKMASAGADYLTNAQTQIRWGLGYVGGRYGSPLAAWAHEEKYGWYDRGGIASGLGFMPKHTPRPERVLSPEQTTAFERLVDTISGGGGGRMPVALPKKISIDLGKSEMTVREWAVDEAKAEIAFANR